MCAVCLLLGHTHATISTKIYEWEATISFCAAIAAASTAVRCVDCITFFSANRRLARTKLYSSN